MEKFEPIQAMTHDPIPKKERERIGKELVLNAFGLAAEKAIGSSTDYQDAYREIAIQLTYQKKLVEKENNVLKKQIDTAIESVRNGAGLSEGYMPITDEEQRLCKYSADLALRVETLRTQLEQEGAARETLAKTMIALDLSTGHGDTIEDLCAELRSQWEELRTKVKFYENPIDGLRLEYDPLRPHLARLIDSDGNWEWVAKNVIGLWATLQKQNENLFKMRATP